MHLYCHVPSVYKIYIKRHQNKLWGEQESREDNRFLELEMEIWHSMLPNHTDDLLDEDNEEDDAAILLDGIDDGESSEGV
jgi:hypothetical protein